TGGKLRRTELRRQRSAQPLSAGSVTRKKEPDGNGTYLRRPCPTVRAERSPRSGRSRSAAKCGQPLPACPSTSSLLKAVAIHGHSPRAALGLRSEPAPDLIRGRTGGLSECHSRPAPFFRAASPSVNGRSCRTKACRRDP